MTYLIRNQTLLNIIISVLINVTVSNFSVSSPIFLTSVALSFSTVFLTLELLKSASNLTELQQYHWLVISTSNSVKLSWKNSRIMRFHSYQVLTSWHEASILKIWKWSSTSIFLETVKPTLTVQVVPAVWEMKVASLAW